MADSVVLSRKNYENFLSESNKIINELKKINTGVKKNRVQEWIVSLVETIKTGIDDQTSEDNTDSQTRESQTFDSNIDSQDSVQNLDTQVSSEDTKPEEWLTKKEFEEKFQILVNLVTNKSTQRQQRSGKILNNRYQNNKTVQSNRNFPKKCYVCQRYGHLARNCYQNSNRRQERENERQFRTKVYHSNNFRRNSRNEMQYSSQRQRPFLNSGFRGQERRFVTENEPFLGRQIENLRTTQQQVFSPQTPTYYQLIPVSQNQQNYYQ